MASIPFEDEKKKNKEVWDCHGSEVGLGKRPTCSKYLLPAIYRYSTCRYSTYCTVQP